MRSLSINRKEENSLEIMFKKISDVLDISLNRIEKQFDSADNGILFISSQKVRKITNTRKHRISDVLDISLNHIEKEFVSVDNGILFLSSQKMRKITNTRKHTIYVFPEKAVLCYVSVYSHGYPDKIWLKSSHFSHQTELEMSKSTYFVDALSGALITTRHFICGGMSINMLHFDEVNYTRGPVNLWNGVRDVSETKIKIQEFDIFTGTFFQKYVVGNVCALRHQYNMMCMEPSSFGSCRESFLTVEIPWGLLLEHRHGYSFMLSIQLKKSYLTEIFDTFYVCKKQRSDSFDRTLTGLLQETEDSYGCCVSNLKGYNCTPQLCVENCAKCIKQHCQTDLISFLKDTGSLLNNEYSYSRWLSHLQKELFSYRILELFNISFSILVSQPYSIDFLSLGSIVDIYDQTKLTMLEALLLKVSLAYDIKNSLRILKSFVFACLVDFHVILKRELLEVHCDNIELNSQEIDTNHQENHCRDDESYLLTEDETYFHNGVKISSVEEMESDYTLSSPSYNIFSFKVKGYSHPNVSDLEMLCNNWFAHQWTTESVCFSKEKMSYPIEVSNSYTVFPVLKNDLEYSFQKILSGTPAMSSEIMRFEHHRLATFKHYKGEDSPSFILLAKAGWFATGNGTETLTFCCSIIFSKWNRVLDPLLVHKDLAPTCPFITGLDVGQVSVQQKELKEQSCHTYGEVTETRRNAEASSGNENEIINGLENTHINCNGISNNSHADDTSHAVQNHVDGMQWRRELINHELPPRQANTRTDFASSGTCSVDCNSQSIADGQNEHRRYVRQGQNRMDLVAKTENSRAPIGPDRRTWSNNQNAAVSASVNGNIHQNNSRQDNSEFETPELPPTLPNIPKHPEYSAVATRISSYSGFPSYTGQSVRVLAMAGFYYRSFSDRTVCFSCGLCIQNWRREDDPYIEHARFSVRCYYLRQLKGDDFVKLVVFATRPPQVSSSLNRTTGNPIHEEYRIRESTLFDLREMGFTEESINAAISHLKSINERPTKQKIINIILENNDAFEVMAAEIPPYTEDEEVATNNDSSDETDPSLSESSGIELGTGASNAMAPKSVSSMSSAEIKEQFICKICMDEKVGVVFTPCGHIVTCQSCSRKIRKCPICRVYISEKIKTFIIE